MIEPLNQIKLSELEKLPQEELLEIVKKVQELKEGQKFKRLEQYLKNANEGQIRFHKDPHRIRFILAGNRCVAKGTQIWTIEGLKNIEDLVYPTLVLSRGATGKLLWRPSTPSYCKPGGPALEISHGTGRFVVSKTHRILSDHYEYQPLEEVYNQGFSLFLPNAICWINLVCYTLIFYLQGLLSNGLQWKQKLLNYVVHCLALFRRYDRHFLFQLGISPLLLLRQTCVTKFFHTQHNLYKELEDEKEELIPSDNRLAELTGPSSTLDYSDQLEGSAFFEEDSGDPEFFSRELARSPSVSLFALMKLFRQIVQKLFSSSLQNSQKFTIKEIKEEPVFYDITVQSTHNYIDESGFVHENSGKTTAGTIELIWRCLGLHPFQKIQIPIQSAVVLQDFDSHNKLIFEPKLMEWVPPGAIKKVERHQGGALKRIVWSTGSTTDFYSHDQDMRVFEGSSYSYVWMDEPPPKGIWNAMWRSCTDKGGLMVMTGTPLASPWLYEEYQKWKTSQDPLKNFIQYDSYTNAKNLGEGDEQLGRKRIDELASQYSPEEQEARIRGGFIQLSGLIFKNWDRKAHVIEPFSWPHNWPIIESIDPHSQKDWAVSWVGIAPNGSKVLIHSGYFGGVLDEIANDILLTRHNLGIKDGLKPKIERCLIDNAASVPLWQRSNTDITARRLSLREELENLIGPRAQGPRIEVCPKNVSQKIDIFRRWLHVKEHKGVTRADFFVFNKPENDGFLYEMENYVWDRYRNRHSEGLKAKPVKKNDDLLDTIMQICLILKDGDDISIEPMATVENYGTYGL